MSDPSLADLATAQYGAFSTAQALDCGLTRDQIKHRIRVRRWLPLNRGTYLMAGTPKTPDCALAGALLAAGSGISLKTFSGAVASHRSAARLWKLIPATSSQLSEVLVHHKRKPYVRNSIVRRTRHLPSRDYTRLRGIPVTCVGRTLVDLSSVLPLDALEEAVEDALRRSLLTLDALNKRLAGVPKGTVGIGRLRCLAGLRPVSGSTLEIKFRRALLAAGLRPDPQFEICGADGKFIARVDFAFPDQRLALEVDGFAYHGGRKAWENDIDRLNAIAERGWQIRRFTSSDLSPARLAATIRAVTVALGTGEGWV